MAAPSEKTLKDLNGVWIMNKTLSDDTDYILQMQGVSWLVRKAIAMATITLTISEYIDSGTKLTHIDIKSVANAGISSTEEKRTLDWTYRDHKDGIFGSVKGRSRWVALKDVDDDEFLKNGWEGVDGDFVQSYVESKDNGWTANQIWGFESVGGERRHTRHVVVRKGDDWKLARLVYDYHGTGKASEEDDDDGLAYE